MKHFLFFSVLVSLNSFATDKDLNFKKYLEAQILDNSMISEEVSVTLNEEVLIFRGHSKQRISKVEDKSKNKICEVRISLRQNTARYGSILRENTARDESKRIMKIDKVLHFRAATWPNQIYPVTTYEFSNNNEDFMNIIVENKCSIGEVIDALGAQGFELKI